VVQNDKRLAASHHPLRLEKPSAVATPTQTLQAVPNQIKIRFTKSLQILLSETLERRNIKTVERYILELVENDVAPLRLELWRAKFAPRESIERKIAVQGRFQARATKQKVLELHDEGVPSSSIAERVCVSHNTVCRILRERDEET
jgi:hypothetical protein